MWICGFAFKDSDVYPLSISSELFGVPLIVRMYVANVLSILMKRSLTVQIRKVCISERMHMGTHPQMKTWDAP